MRRINHIIIYIIIFVIVSTIASCTSWGPHYVVTYNGQKFKTYSICRPYIGITTYRNGCWGEWSRASNLRTKVSYNGSTTIITYYSKFGHPGDFDYRIEIKKYIGLDNGWDKYEGEITIKKDCESKMRDFYSKPMTGVQALKDYWTFPCTIKRTYEKLPEEKYIHPSLETPLKYVYNVWYNGVARGFGISGQWVGADEYDSW